MNKAGTHVRGYWDPGRHPVHLPELGIPVQARLSDDNRSDNAGEMHCLSKLGVPTHWGVPTGLTPPALAIHKSCRGPLIDSSRPIGFSRCSIIGTKSLKD